MGSLVFAACAVLFTSCGGDEKDDGTPGAGGTAGGSLAGSCENATGGFCNEFNGSSYKAASVEAICKGETIKFLAGVCPTEGRVGTCVVKKGTPQESKYRYYEKFPGTATATPASAASSAEQQCASLKGEWAAG